MSAWPPACRMHPRRRRGGQTVIFLLIVLVILFFVVLWNVDLHKSIHVKMVSQNGGDAAALMGARWQGISLNLVGDLNILSAIALANQDATTANAISNLQARLLIHGPMIGFIAAQQAAKNNGVHQNDDFTRMVRDHAQTVRYEYPQAVGDDGELMYPEPYPGAWEEYADMLDLAVTEGIAAAPDNARYFSDVGGDHILLDPAFYDAIAGRSWCWFHWNAPDLLGSYTDYTWWPPLPEIVPGEYLNAEFFGLGLSRFTAAIEPLVPLALLDAIAEERSLTGGPINTGNPLGSATWYGYGDAWGPWEALARDSEDPFPVVGPLRATHDYAGADAAVRVRAHATRLTPGAAGESVTNIIVWTAAAKPFGSLQETDAPTTYPLVLPAFHDIRLIPVDASSAPAGGFDPEWRHFIEEDLPHYVATGELNCNSWYCEQLRTWEDASFRQDGVDWLRDNVDQCNVSGGGGGGGGGGGRRRGH